MPEDWELLEKVASILPGHVYWKSLDGIYRGCNEEQAKTLKLKSKDEIIGKTDYDLCLTRKEAEKIIKNDRSVMETGIPKVVEEISTDPEGKIAVYLSKKAPLRDKDNNIIGLIGVSFDITKEKKSQEEKEFILDNIIGMMPGHVYWKDKNCVLQGCNDQQAMDAGLNSRHDIVGKTAYDLLYQDQPELEKRKQANITNKIDQKIMCSGNAEIIEEFVVLPGKSKAIYLSHKVPLRDQRGNVIGLVGISFDITKEKAAQKIKQASKSKSRFLTTIDRLVRSYLNAILGSAQLLSLSNLDKKQREKTDLIQHSGQAITQMFDRCRFYLSLEDGDLISTSNEFELKPFVKAQINKFGDVIKDKNILLVFNYDHTLPDWVNADKYFISQALTNVLSNAVRYTAAGTISVNVKQQQCKEDISYVEFVVQDTGQGIRPESQSTLFNLFNRENINENDQAFTDAGLNLSISAKMIEILGGKISVSSQINKGSTFIISTPLKIIDEPFREFEKFPSVFESSQQELSKKSKKSRRKKIRVLIIEDEPIAQRILKWMLEESFTCKITQIYNLKNALKEINGTYDIIFLDMNLPDGNGMEFLKLLKREKGNKHPPVIVVTAYYTEDERLAITDAGAEDIVAKPVDFELLTYLVNLYVFEETQSEK